MPRINIVAVKVWIRATNEDAFCFAARLPEIAYDNNETEFVMDTELTPAMRLRSTRRAAFAICRQAPWTAWFESLALSDWSVCWQASRNLRMRTGAAKLEPPLFENLTLQLIHQVAALRLRLFDSPFLFGLWLGLVSASCIFILIELLL